MQSKTAQVDRDDITQIALVLAATVAVGALAASGPEMASLFAGADIINMNLGDLFAGADIINMNLGDLFAGADIINQ